MQTMDEESGENLVWRDEAASCVALHIRGERPDEYQAVRLSRQEARRLAALILFRPRGWERRLGRPTPRCRPDVKPRNLLPVAYSTSRQAGLTYFRRKPRYAVSRHR
jgi:hypothetical protein